MNQKNLKIMGWREWVSLPELGIEKIKAKIDTGAKTSTLHAFAVKPFKKGGKDWVQFMLHPKQRDTETVVACCCELVDIRWVTDSSGRREERFVIKTPIVLGDDSWPIEITLNSRETLRFRMLIGRFAIKNRFIIDCARSYVCSRRP